MPCSQLKGFNQLQMKHSLQYIRNAQKATLLKEETEACNCKGTIKGTAGLKAEY